MWQEGPTSKLDRLLLTVCINGPFFMQENEYLHFLGREGQVEKDTVCLGASIIAIIWVQYLQILVREFKISNWILS